MPSETARLPVVQVPAKVKLGPAMSKLTENQQNFVWAMVETGGMSTNKAAAMAGFGGTDGSRRVAVHRLMHDEDVIAAINEAAGQRMRYSGLLAAEALIQVVQDVGHKDRVKAIGMLLDQSEHIVVRKQEIVVTKPEPSTAEIVAKIRNLAAALNVDPRPLLLNAGVEQSIIDAEFEVVEETRPNDTDQQSPTQRAAESRSSGPHESPGRTDAGAAEPPGRDSAGGDLAAAGGRPDGGPRGDDDLEDDWSAL